MKIFNNTDEMDDVDSWLAGVEYERDNDGQIVIYTGLFEWSDGSIHDEPETKEHK